MTHPNGLPANGQPANGQPVNAHPWPAARPQPHAPQEAGHAQAGYSGYQAAAPQTAQGWPQQSAAQAQTHAPYQAPAAQSAPQSPSQLANYYAQQTGQPQNGGHFSQQPYAYPDTYSQPQAAQAQPSYASQADNRYAQPAPQRGYEQQWANAQQAQDPRGYDIGSYHPANAGQHAAHGYADPGYGHPGDPNLDQHYEDGGEYEVEEPKRGSRLTMIAAALVGAIAVGGALAYGYTNLIAPDGNGPTPLVKSAEGPSKTKPSDPGGKQFSHSDSKIMGRLAGDGTTNSIDTAVAGSSSSSDSDSSGARKVQTLVVGRDGSIAGPAAVVPGMTVVDAFGGKTPPLETAAVTAPSAPTAPAVDTKPAAAAVEKAAATVAKPITISPPIAPVKPAVVAKAAPATPTATDAAPVALAKLAAPVTAPKTVTATVDPAAAAPVAKKPAAAAPAATAPVSTSSTGNGFVAVLASVPVSANSRMSALKQFADMQQKYSTALQSKQPDVQEANLGDKGKYHRLLAGPPGSREQASALCGQLKSAGYGDCWVMAY